MAMNINQASNKLFDELKYNREVVGTGIKRTGNISYIIIYLTNATQAILNKIPSEYQGNQVKTEVSTPFSF